MNFQPVIRHYTKSSFINENRISNDPDWQASIDSTGSEEAKDITATFALKEGRVCECALGLRFDFENWSTDNYVCMPAAVYAGNRFESRPIPYPPLLRDPADWGVDAPAIITDVPRLNISEGTSRIQLMTRDMVTPAFGVFFPKTKQGLWILTEQGTRLGDSGFDLRESDDRTHATFTLLAPGMREELRYHGMQLQTYSEDRGADFNAGDEVTIRCKVYVFDCADIPAFFDKFVSIRKAFSENPRVKHELPLSAAWEILEEKYNRDNWKEKYGNYSIGTGETLCDIWQLGWVGGGLATHSLLVDGNDLSKERALKNLDFMLVKSVAPSNFLYGTGDGEHFYCDAFGNEIHPHNMHLIRKNADALYFALKQFMILDEMGKHSDIKDEWTQSTKNLADAFVRLWERYGQFGQFIDIETGNILIGGSTCASTAPAGLALASKYFNEPKYLDIAVKSAEIFYNRDICNGITTGGPGEILQCPDSESAFGLLESFVVLYEVTDDRIWIERAEDAANQCATWCVSYDYKFPPDSLFGKLDMRTTGSVWANVQNKHSAPGIATLSGNSLFKLYRATGNTIYLDLLKDITHGITQYLSREDRPVGNMPSGWMNERVNMCDWLEPIGEIFYGSCWCEVSCILTFTEVPGLYVQRDTGLARCFDNIDVSDVKKTDTGVELTLTNPTRFPATVKMIVEDSYVLSSPITASVMLGSRKIAIAAGSSVIVTV